VRSDIGDVEVMTGLEKGVNESPIKINFVIQ